MSSAWSIIDPVFPAWIILPLAILLFVFFGWKEVKRAQTFVPARLLSLLLVLLSLLGLLLRPAYRKSLEPRDIVLLTPGYDKTKVDSVSKISADVRLVRTRDAADYPLCAPLTNTFDLADFKDDIRTIIGEGLSDDALELIDSATFKFIPRALPWGVIQLSMSRHMRAHQENIIEGVFNSNGITKLKLLGPAGIEDSVELKDGRTSFSLTCKPKRPGQFIYNLVAIDHNGNAATEKLPVQVDSQRKLNILFLQKFPTAEIRYLKNFLTEKGHELVLRYQISRNKYRYEYANHQPIKADRLTPESIKPFDLIIIDNDVLDEWSEDEKDVLERAVYSGLGVLILTDRLPEKGKTTDRFLPFNSARSIKDTVHLRIQNSKQFIFPVIPYEVLLQSAVQEVTTHNNRVLSGYTFAGRGKIAFQLLRETYRLLLEGNEGQYSSMWSPLIEQTSKSGDEAFKLDITTPFPYYSDKPLTVGVISSGVQPTLYADNTLLPAIEDVMLDDYWTAKCWSGNPGWHQFSVREDSTKLDYFVSSQGEWEALRISNQMKANMLAQSSLPHSNVRYKKSVTTLIPPLLFYLTFLLSAGFLWLAPKL